MRLLFIAIGMALVMSTGAQAHKSATVMIKHADKVMVKTGMSQKKIMGMVHCLNTLKKYDSEESALEAAKAKIEAKCAANTIDADKCAKKQRKVARHIYNCFAKAEFLREYIKAKAPDLAKE